MTLITREIGEFILNSNASPARLSIKIIEEFGIKLHRETIRRFINNPKRHALPTKNKKELRKMVQNPGIVYPKNEKKPSPVPERRASEIPSFSEFMNKMEKSDSWSAKLLKEKLNVRGKAKKQNQDRILRVIQYTLDILKEEFKR